MSFLPSLSLSIFLTCSSFTFIPVFISFGQTPSSPHLLFGQLLYPSFSILSPFIYSSPTPPLLISPCRSFHMLTGLLVPAFASPFDPTVLLNLRSSSLLSSFSHPQTISFSLPLPHTTTPSLPSSAKDAHYLYQGTEKIKLQV